MLDRLAAHAHRLWVGIEPLLHCFEQMFVLPSRDASFRTCRTTSFERTTRTSGSQPSSANTWRAPTGCLFDDWATSVRRSASAERTVSAIGLQVNHWGNAR